MKLPEKNVLSLFDITLNKDKWSVTPDLSKYLSNTFSVVYVVAVHPLSETLYVLVNKG